MNRDTVDKVVKILLIASEIAFGYKSEQASYRLTELDCTQKYKNSDVYISRNVLLFSLMWFAALS